MRILAPEEFHELFDCHFGLNDDGFDCLWRQISAVPRNHDMKMRFGRVAEVDVTALLMMDIETRSQKNLQHLARRNPWKFRHQTSKSFLVVKRIPSNFLPEKPNNHDLGS